MFPNISAVEHSAILNPAPTSMHGHDPIHPLTHLTAFVGLRARPHMAEELLLPPAHAHTQASQPSESNTTNSLLSRQSGKQTAMKAWQGVL